MSLIVSAAYAAVQNLLLLVISLYMLTSFIFIKEKNFLFFKIKKNNQSWIEIWNINTDISSLENLNQSSWNIYYKYKLTMLTSWHILEERIMIFLIIIIQGLF